MSIYALFYYSFLNSRRLELAIKKKKRKKRNSADKKSIECDDGAPIRLSAAFKNISYKSLDEKAKEKEVRGRRLTDSCVHDGKTDC